MYYPVEFVVKSYKPLQFEPGQRFLTKLYIGTIKEHTEIWELTRRPINEEEFLQKNGYPIELYIINDDGSVLVESEQIGWFDEGDHVDEYRDITLGDINKIIQIHDGIVEMLIDEEAYEDGLILPVLAEGKAIFRFPVEEYEEEDDFPQNTDEDVDLDFENFNQF